MAETRIVTSIQTETTLKEKFYSIFLILIGSLTIVFYIFLFRFNKAVFVAFVCVYIIAYSLYVIIYMNNKKQCFNDEIEYTVLSYISIYTMFIATVMFVLSMVLMKHFSKPTPTI
jgi:hypothetical protein